MARLTSRRCCLRKRLAICRCAICRQMAAAPPSPPCSAAMSISSCRRHRSRCRTSAPGKVNALAVSSAKRVKALPDVPTFKELGYNLEYYFWVGILRAKGYADANHQHVARRIQKGRAQQAVSRHDRKSRPGTRLYGPAGICEILGSRRQAAGRRDQSPSVACKDKFGIAGGPAHAGFGFST